MEHIDKLMIKQKIKMQMQRRWGSIIDRLMGPSLPGFTLIELSIVMIIIGIITAAVFKGQDLIETARLQATLSEFNRIKMMLIQYREQYGQWPGNDSRATQRFGQGVTDGDGAGSVQPAESSHVWIHLAKGGLLDSEDAPTAKIGGHFMVLSDISPALKGNWIILTGKSGAMLPALTPKQALQLKSKLDESTPDKGQLRVIDGAGIGDNKCLTGNTYNINNKSPACVVLMSF